MHMIRYDNRDVEKMFYLILMHTALQSDSPCSIGEQPAAKCAEGHEMALIVAPQVRQFSSVEGHKRPHRDSRRGCPPSEARLPNITLKDNGRYNFACAKTIKLWFLSAKTGN